MPVAALCGLVLSLYKGVNFLPAVQNALIFLLAVFGCWALARELLPDDHPAAFVSMALGFLVCLVLLSPGLLVLFTTLGLVRVVNRSTGLEARTSDSIIVTLLVIWSIYTSQSPWIGAVAAVTFFLDGVLSSPQKKQWLYALICFGSMVIFMVDHHVPWWRVMVPDTLLEWLALLALLLFALNIILLKKVHSKGDVNDRRLNLERVKAGMVIGVLATLQGLDNITNVVLLVATIGGLCLGITFRKAFRSPAKGLRAG
jgi:hypothetical protein